MNITEIVPPRLTCLKKIPHRLRLFETSSDDVSAERTNGGSYVRTEHVHAFERGELVGHRCLGYFTGHTDSADASADKTNREAADLNHFTINKSRFGRK